ncbi:MAG: hypothetical protein JSU66_13785 [Deltaproteobacteria bacterium]|nr:MAG: hypothetical protein JSU66_13785 [Deltaproteobacteria bacterium]
MVTGRLALCVALGWALASLVSGCQGTVMESWRSLPGAAPLVGEPRQCTVTGTLVKLEVLDDTEPNFTGDDDWQVGGQVRLPGTAEPQPIPQVEVADLGTGAERALDQELFSTKLPCGESAEVKMSWQVSELDDGRDDSGGAEQAIGIACDTSGEALATVDVEGTGFLNNDGQVRLTTRFGSDAGCD